MSEDLTLTPFVADELLTCFQCTNIGLPPNGIAIGELCMLIVSPTKKLHACMDCFNRLNEEIEQIKSDEEIGQSPDSDENEKEE